MGLQWKLIENLRNPNFSMNFLACNMLWVDMWFASSNPACAASGHETQSYIYNFIFPYKTMHILLSLLQRSPNTKTLFFKFVATNFIITIFINFNKSRIILFFANNINIPMSRSCYYSVCLKYSNCYSTTCYSVEA